MKGLITAAAVLVVLGIGFLLYSSPTAAPEMTEAEIAQIEAEVLGLMESWMEAWRGNDCALSRDLWHPTKIAQPRVGRTGISVDGWIESCTTQMANRESFSGEWTDTDVRVISPEAAVFSGTYRATYGYRDGSPGRHYPTAAQVMLVERTEGGWGITFFTNSNGPSEEVGEEG